MLKVPSSSGLMLESSKGISPSEICRFSEGGIPALMIPFRVLAVRVFSGFQPLSWRRCNHVLQTGRLSAKRFRNSSSEKWMEKWLFAAGTALLRFNYFFVLLIPLLLSAPALSVVKQVVKEPFLTRCGTTAVACSEGLFSMYGFWVLYLW